MKIKRWLIAEPDIRQVRALSEACGFTTLAAATLCARGMTIPAEAEKFLHPPALHDPRLLTDMDAAVRTITAAIQSNKRIIVFGDYDVDGITATCVLTDYLCSVGANCGYYIPDRMSEGYGLNCAAIDRLRKEGAELIITVDSGITAYEEVSHAAQIGLQMVITDHHECREEQPVAKAVINPKRPDSAYPFRELAGVGVAFKLVAAIMGSQEEALARYADLVALGTIADVMPIIGENRLIVSEGLRRMSDTHNLGLEMLLREAGMWGKKLTAGTVSYVLAPRINAAGRMGSAALAAELFLTADANRARRLAALLCEKNKARQTAENQILNQTLAVLRREYNPIEDKIIVLAGEGWHHGVIGIVSSRLCDRYSCPVMLISLEGEMGKGSGRSIKGFNLFEALSDAGELLEKYGGHELAAGLTIHRSQVEAFKKRITAYAEENLQKKWLNPTLQIDCEIDPKWIDLENVRGLSVMEPFGMKNPEPVFMMADMLVEDIMPISSDRHVRLSLRKNGVLYTAMLFGTGTGGCNFAQGNYIDVAFHLEINEFRGKRTVQLNVRDVHLSRCEVVADQKLLNVYNSYMGDQPLTAEQAQLLLPNRKDLVAVWRHIFSRAEDGRLSVPSNGLSRRISWESKRDINIGKLFVCLDVFSESSLLSYHFKEGLLNIIVKHHEGKADISKSVVLATLTQMAKPSCPQSPAGTGNDRE